MNVKISLEDTIETKEVIELYKANGWSSANGFYKTLGFERAGKTEPMWIYSGNEH